MDNHELGAINKYAIVVVFLLTLGVVLAVNAVNPTKPRITVHRECKTKAYEILGIFKNE